MYSLVLHVFCIGWVFFQLTDKRRPNTLVRFLVLSKGFITAIVCLAPVIDC
jgi:hypothetical protein